MLANGRDESPSDCLACLFARVHFYQRSVVVVVLVENVGKRTPSDPMESVAVTKSPSDCLGCQFVRQSANGLHRIR